MYEYLLILNSTNARWIPRISSDRRFKTSFKSLTFLSKILSKFNHIPIVKIQVPGNKQRLLAAFVSAFTQSLTLWGRKR